MENNTATFFVNDLTIYTLEDENYFIGKEICELLDYKIITTTLLCVSPINKLYFKDFKGEKTPQIDPRAILITKNGIEEILNSNRVKKINDNALYVLDSYDIRPINGDDRELTEYSYFTHDKLLFEYFVGYEITALLGYKCPHQTVKNTVSKSNQIYFKDYVGEKIPPLNPKTVLITRDGAIEILLKTRKILTPDVEYILKKFNITTTNRKCLSKEQKYMTDITTVFKTEQFEDQYKVGEYYLDLYFTEYRIVIECDENGHLDRRQCDEKERMKYVNNSLGIDDSYWIRFNPDEYNFDISKVLGRLNLLIKAKGKYTGKKISEDEKNIDLVFLNTLNAPITLQSLRELCNKYELKKKGSKEEHIERLKHFLETGEKLKKVVVEKKVIPDHEKKLDLQNLETVHYSKLRPLCKKYGISQEGNKQYLIEKLSDFLRTGNRKHGNSVSIYQYDLNGNFIASHDSITEVSKTLGIQADSVADCSKGYKQNYGGFIWRRELMEKIGIDQLEICNNRTGHIVGVIKMDSKNIEVERYASIVDFTSKTGISSTALDRICRTGEINDGYKYIKERKFPLTDVQIAEIKDKYKEGTSVKQLSDMYKKSVKQLRRVLKKN